MNRQEGFSKLCQWTDGDGRVRLLKTVGPDRRSRGGFLWPNEGAVRPECCSTSPDCDSGGLFGWPWGVGIREGKAVFPDDLWVVFSAPPEQVVPLRYKAKVAADRPEDVDCRVLCCGSLAHAWKRLQKGLSDFSARHGTTRRPREDCAVVGGDGLVDSHSLAFDAGPQGLLAMRNLGATTFSGGGNSISSCPEIALNVGECGLVVSNRLAVASGCKGTALANGSGIAVSTHRGWSVVGNSGVAVLAYGGFVEVGENGVAVCQTSDFWCQLGKGAVLIVLSPFGQPCVYRADDVGKPGQLLRYYDGKFHVQGDSK